MAEEIVEEYRAPGAPPRDERPPEAVSMSGPHRWRWVFHGAPISGPGGHVPFMVPEEYADDLARHLDSLGFYRRDELVERAGPDGMLDVTALRSATMRLDPPAEGPDTWLNPGQWVPVSTPAPEAHTAEPPDLREMDDATAAALEADAEAVREALRRRAVWKAKLDDADPEARGEGTA